MINSIQKIKNLGCYEEFLFDGNLLKPFNKINILFGNNGSGKTTLSNTFFLLSKYCKNKNDLFTELINSDTEIEIEIDEKKIKTKDLQAINLDLYVFNSKFVADHVFNGTNANIASFSNEVKLTTPEIEKIDSKLNSYKQKHERLSLWKTSIQNKLDLIFKKYNDQFQANISGARLTGVKPIITDKYEGNIQFLQDELQELYKKYEKKNNEEIIIEKLRGFKQRVENIKFVQIDFHDLNRVIATMPINEVKESLAKRIDLTENSVKDLKREEILDWFKKGGNLLLASREHFSYCPLCNTNLSDVINDVINDFQQYFSKQVVLIYDTLDVAANTLKASIEQDILKEVETSTRDIVNSLYVDFSIVVEPFAFESGFKQQFKKSLLKVLEILESKRRRPEIQMKIETGTIDTILLFNQKVKDFIEDVLSKIKCYEEELKVVKIENLVKDIKSKIKLICVLDLNQSENLVVASRKKANSDIALQVEKMLKSLNQFILDAEGMRSSEISKLNAESKYINLYLRIFGITNFEITSVKNKEHDNIIITYTKTGRKKTKLDHSLSEGEKTALAFAYFISKLRAEKIDSGNKSFQESIIVIDDPISSLDDNRVYQTANLIDSFLFHNGTDSQNNPLNGHPRQLFILSHNLPFIKYLHNALKSNDILSASINEYYISYSKPILRKLPSGLKNFTNTYILKLREIIDFKEGRLDYEIVKNYLPNYIRIVLETFLAFKLALVNDSHNRLPGLLFLINGIIKEFDIVEDVTVDGINKDGAIKRLNHLKKIADHESHGSIYRAEEFTFISEEELKVFAKNVLQIINFIDYLHFKRIRNHTA